MHLPHIAVVVTTYNWPRALAAVLESLEHQSYGNFEVLVADDGSGRATAGLIEELSERGAYPLRHVWQEDEGFRAAAIRNQAVAHTRAEYILFLDGDCLVRPDFLQRHALLARRGHFVAGNRVLLSRVFSQRVLEHGLPVAGWGAGRWLAARLLGGINRFLSLARLPLGRLRDRAPGRWEGVKTCNLGLWRKDFLAVNGLDERYRGWGYEDSDLVIRLIRNGVGCRDGRFATTVLHLWHQEHQREGTAENLARLQALEKSSVIRAGQGVERYLS
jgi:glycosyltransferase involved in cell wall biosynthesis